MTPENIKPKADEDNVIDNTFLNVQRAVNRMPANTEKSKINAIKDFNDMDLSERSDSISDYH